MGNLMNEKTYILLFILFISCIDVAFVQAQTKHVTIQGTILEEDTQLPIGQATIQLLSLPDSNYVKGASSLEQGNFTLTTPPGHFLIKLSFIGFTTEFKTLQINNTTKPFIQLEELVKKLPGAEINEDGKLTINGEEIKNYRQESDIKNLNILSKRITNGKHLIIHSERKLI